MIKNVNWMAVVFVLLAGCSRDAKVGEVWGAKRTQTINAADQDLFVTDRASRLRMQTHPLPAEEQREEFLATWSGSGGRVVKFEYRQVNVPDTIVVLSAPAIDRHSHRFTIAGEEFAKGGPVTAWRVSLWSGDKVLDEKKSTLW